MLTRTWIVARHLHARSTLGVPAMSDGPEDFEEGIAPIHVLLAEDNADDAALCIRELSKARMELRCDVVTTPEEFAAHLRAKRYDIVLSDYNLGTWTGADAFGLLSKAGQDAPFVLVTGALGEEKAVECIKLGMADYVLKDHLARLPLAMTRALNEASLRQKRANAEKALQDSEAKFRTLADTIPAGIFVEQGNRCKFVNRTAEEMTGYTRAELAATTFWQLLHPDSKDILRERKPTESVADTFHEELKIQAKNNESRWVDVRVAAFQLKGALASVITAFDITDGSLRL
jgi:PAS domain S-box-containing protein